MAHAPIALRTLAVVIILLSSLAGTTSARVVRASVAGSDRAAKPTLVEDPLFAFPADEAAHGAVVASFIDAGYDVPAVHIEFHADDAPCKGYFGLHVVDAEGRSTINVCYTNPRPMAQELAREHTLRHELAHAWVNQNVDRAQRDAFMAIRGLTAWDRGAGWGELGAEHAAEIVLWGMTGGAHSINVQIDDSDEAELAAAYRILIGGPGTYQSKRSPISS